MKMVDLGEPTSFLGHVYLGCTQRACITDEYKKMFESRISSGATEKLPGWEKTARENGRVVLRHGRTCPKKSVERYCELAKKKTEQLNKVSTPCLDDHTFKKEERESVGELSKACSQIVLKCLYLTQIGRPDILWSVNKLARAVTRWSRACDRRLARLIALFIKQMITNTVVVWETRLSIVDWVYFNTLILLETLRTRNQPRVNLMYLRKLNICSH